MLKISYNFLKKNEEDSGFERFNGKIMAYSTKFHNGNEYRINGIMFAYLFKGEKSFHMDPLKRKSFENATLYNPDSYKDLKVRFPLTRELIELEEGVKEDQLCFRLHSQSNQSRIKEIITNQLEETARREFLSNFSVREFS